ncbi:hypothetical protein COX85_03475 [Candidatus Micrarchaeota archaeon CG_4_10_14_0_2_um_filter_55_9]|nr:MAG: hypothetical protein AUJ15_02650 [Candidatus Micrarchaeota archaeon CG1_02_55_41]PIZ91514.1 MAG: hypothetical protein COX85_03475 [Candidatus Micrarchaeota archaeon CG_4_10_14_0_2_um_filter_55_9]QBM01480.1 hypothetical protein [uncultured archaeon]
MKKFDVDVLRRTARNTKMNLGNAEKDYVLSAALSKMVETKLAEKLVFKGGTCIKKIYFPEFRFSSDLDFSLIQEKDWIQEIRKAFENKTVEGVRFTKVKRLERTKENVALTIQYESQISEPGHVDSIRVEITRENPLLMKPKNQPVRNPKDYDLPEIRLPCMQLEEIFAEKIHAVYNRPKSRDLYDVDFLLAQNVKPDKRLIEKKLALISTKLTLESFKERMRILEPHWERDLKQVMAEAPDFEETTQRVIEKLPFNTLRGSPKRFGGASWN